VYQNLAEVALLEKLGGHISRPGRFDIVELQRIIGEGHF